MSVYNEKGFAGTVSFVGIKRVCVISNISEGAEIAPVCFAGHLKTINNQIIAPSRAPILQRFVLRVSQKP